MQIYTTFIKFLVNLKQHFESNNNYNPIPYQDVTFNKTNLY
jgi:hypothetical protein